MPSWKIHLIFDLIFVIVFVEFLIKNTLINDIFLLIFLVSFNILATLFPDIDTPKSKIRKYISLILALIFSGYLIINFSFNSFFSLIIILFLFYLIIRFFPTKHRGMTHTFWFSVVFSLGLTIIFWLMFEISLFEFGVSFLVIFWGYLSHLILDKIT